MTDYSEQEFNEHCARLDDNYFPAFNINDEETTFLPDYFNNLNLLMPLAWKYYITIQPYRVTDTGVETWLARNNDLQNCIDANPNKAIRDCLMQIPVDGEE